MLSFLGAVFFWILRGFFSDCGDFSVAAIFVEGAYVVYVLARVMEHLRGAPAFPGSLDAAELFSGGRDVLMEKHGAGIRILAPSELSMNLAVARILVYMPGVFRPRALEIRLLEKPEPAEPVMRFLIVPPPSMDRAVRRVLLWRQLVATSVEVGGLLTCLQGEAPMARLLGLGTELRGATGREMPISVRFSHYAPLAQREVAGVYATV